MLLKQTQLRRHGTYVAEMAIVAPVVFFFIFAIIVGALGIFRYQQVAYLAREATRYASCHAGTYASTVSPLTKTTYPPAAGTYPIVDDAFLTSLVQYESVAMPTADLTVTVNLYSPSNTSTNNDWDNTANYPNGNQGRQTFTPGASYQTTNTVSVTVKYQWVPELYLAGPINLSSTSIMPLCY